MKDSQDKSFFLFIVALERCMMVMNDISYVPYRNTCYRVGPTRMDWEKSRKYCMENDGDLLSVDSEEERNFLVSKNLL